MRRDAAAWAITVIALSGGCSSEEHAPSPRDTARPSQESDGDREPPARPRHNESLPFVAIDAHVDTPKRMLDEGVDIHDRLPGGHLDIPRMREGGLTGAFFSIWANSTRYSGEAAWQHALALVRAVRAVAEAHPDEAALCTSAADVRRAATEGKVALLMGLEGAHALASDDEAIVIRRLREIHRLGVRYVTITWATDNPLGHASSGEHPDRGLTDLGRASVLEMNRLGMIVDVSHVSDRTVEDVLEVTRRPVFASHSSARSLANVSRNLPDALIRRIAEGGGAVCANFYPQFIDTAYRDARRRITGRHQKAFDALRARHDDFLAHGRAALELALELEPGLTRPTVATLADHVEHIARVGGPGAACLGSDFDGVSELPVGLEDVSKLPALRAELQRRGLDVRAIFGENVLRVLAANAPRPASRSPRRRRRSERGGRASSRSRRCGRSEWPRRRDRRGRA